MSYFNCAIRFVTIPPVNNDHRPEFSPSQSAFILSCLGSPFVFSKISQTSIMLSSPSPIIKTSINSATGNGLKAQGPPAIIIGSESFRISFLYGIFAISSIFKTVGYAISYCKEKPIASKSFMCFLLSSAYNISG